ncbi:MAG: four helix bundle protein [Saprospiraceae bacterium]
MEKSYLTLSKIDAYMIAYKLSNYVWQVVMKWESLSRWTVGKQYIEAVDSISANIAEGFGKYHKKEKIHFYRYSFGSMEESRDWTRKASERNLLQADEIEHIVGELDKLPKAINQLIQFTEQKLKF